MTTTTRTLWQTLVAAPHQAGRGLSLAAALVGALTASASLAQQSGLLDLEQALPIEVETVAGGLTFDVAPTPLNDDQVVEVDGVLFIPLDEKSSDTLWQIQTDAPVRLSAVSFELTDVGLIEAITPLDSVTLAAGATVTLALPTGAGHLEIGTATPAELRLTRIPVPQAEAPAIGQTNALQLAQTVVIPLEATPPVGENLAVTLDLPVNYSALARYTVGGAQLEAPLEAQPAAAPALAASAPVTELTLILTRPAAFNDAPWPVVPLTLNFAPITTDEVEPNQTSDTATLIPWPQDARRVRLAGRLSGGNNEDVWRLIQTEALAARALTIEIEGLGETATTLELSEAETGTVLTRSTGAPVLPSLQLAPGAYDIKLSTKTVGQQPYDLRLSTRRLPREGQEVEPNDLFPRQAVSTNQLFTGTLRAGDLDAYRMTVPVSGHLWSLQTDAHVAVDLLADTGDAILSGGTDGRLTRLGPVLLPIGDYLINLEGSGDYTLTLRDLGPAPQDWEQEPNSAYVHSNRVAVGEQIRGQMDASGRDYVHFNVPTDSLVELNFQPPDDANLMVELFYRDQAAFASHELPAGQEITQIFALEAGEYTYSLSQRSVQPSRDTWRFGVALLENTTIGDIEPNADAYRLPRADGRIVGKMDGLDPQDTYRLPLPPEPGDVYYTCLTGAQTFTGVGISDLQQDGTEVDLLGQRDSLARPIRHEGGPDRAFFIQHFPDTPRTYDCAAYFVADGALEAAFSAAPGRPIDWAPPYATDGPRTITAPTRMSLPFKAGLIRQVIRLKLPGAKLYEVTCDAAQTEMYITVYDADGVSQTAFFTKPGSRARVRTDLTDVFVVFDHKGEAPQPQSCTWMVAETEDPSLLPLAELLHPISNAPSIMLDGSGFYSGTLLPGGLANFPRIDLAPAPSKVGFVDCTFLDRTGAVRGTVNQIVNLSKAAWIDPRTPRPRDGGDFSCRFTTLDAFPTLKPTASPPPKQPAELETRPGWTVPTAFAGGINVALARFGGRVGAGDTANDDTDKLIDGSGHVGDHSLIDTEGSMTFDLAGDSAMPLIGLTYTLRPQSMSLNAPQREVEVAVSSDGSAFTSLGRVRLTVSDDRQYIPLPGAPMATHVRLIPTSCEIRYCMPAIEIGVIAQPGVRPDTLPTQALISDPALGGRLISTTGPIGPQTERDLFTDRFWSLSNDSDEDISHETIIGFWRDRNAQIDEIRWVMAEDISQSDGEIAEIEILALDTILAPPRSFGRLSKPDRGATARLSLPPATYGRYLILRSTLKPGNNILQGRIEVTEAPDSPTYQTILATWEEDSPLGPSDWFTPTPPAALPATVDAPRGDALPLPVGQTAQAQTVKEGAPVWYLLPAAESATPQLRVFTLSAPELVEVGLRLETLDGTDIPLTLVSDPQDIPPSPRPDGWFDQVQFKAEVDPTQPLLLRVAEEGRLMIVRRERTSMLSRVEIQRKRAYEDLADLLGDGFDAIDVGIPTPNGETLLKGRDNILLGMHRLIDPNSDQAVGTTDFGTVVTDAADTIRAWPGGKALVYFGMGGGMMQVADMDWLPAVQDTPVRTISIFAPCDLGNFFCPDDAVAELNPMTFAAATRGDFHRVTNKSAIAEAFAAAATSMTGPKPFAIAWQDTDLPPEPATLMLTLSPADKARAEDIAAAGGNPAPPALSLILDASGSMLRRQDGTRRITLARDALTRLVRETIPDGTQVSYRAFGLAKDACNTRAFAPLGQLDRASLSAAINGTQAINLAKTPIAASLRAAATEDLATAEGQRAIILLTDGEETCDGDVSAELNDLSAQGIDVTLNIVGFAIDDPALKATFESWAVQGNGAYFDATEGAALNTALEDALAGAALKPTPTSAVVSGEQITEQITFGSDLILPPGRYTVTLDTGASRDITLTEGETLSLTTDDF